MVCKYTDILKGIEMKKKGKKKGITVLVCVVAIAVILTCTPGMALRTAAFTYDMGSAFKLEFEKIMEDSAKKREYINKILYGQYKKYAKAAEYITKLELNYGDFKKLVDWEHYKEGGYPAPTTPAKLWSIFDKYAHAMNLMTKYEFTQQNELNKEFGLDIKLMTPHPVKHPWMTAEGEEPEIDEEE